MENLTFKDLYIPKPCHQDWDKMDAAGKDKFCQACQKKVYDFTDKTEEELNALFSLHKGAICGSFYEDQINQNLLHLQNYRNSGSLSWRRALASFVTLVGLNVFSPSQQSYGQAIARTELRLPVKTSENSFVSGYLFNHAQDDEHIYLSNDTLTIKIYLEGKFITKVRAHNGRFFYDFGKKLDPAAKVKLVAKPYSISRKKSSRYRYKFSGATVETTLGNAGAIEIDAGKTKRRKLKSYFMRPKVMGCPKFR